MKNGSQTAFMESSRILIENARDTPSIAQALVGSGYDAARIAQGYALWTTAQAVEKLGILVLNAPRAKKKP